MTDRDEAITHLTRLLDALNDGGEIAARLTASVSVPYLTVSNTAERGISDRVRCRRSAHGTWEYAWGWGPRIAPAGDTETAAAAIRTALRSLSQQAG